MNKKFIDADILAKEIMQRVNNPAIRNWLFAIINEIPAADVQEVRHGTWRGCTKSAYIGSEDELGDPKYADRTFYRCSECRYGSVVKSKFCPNCGGKMDEEEYK